MSRLCLRLTLSLAASVTLLPVCALGQSQNSQSVADAARRVREAKEKAAQNSQKSKVITDDDVKPSSAKPVTDSATAGASTSTTVPQAAQASSSPTLPNGAPASTESDSANPEAASSGQDTKSSDSPEVANAKRALAEAEKELDFLKRELNLDQDSFFSSPNHDRDTAGKAKLAGEQQQVETKQASVDELKARLAKLLASTQPAGQPKAPQP